MLLSFLRTKWRALSAGGIVLILILQMTTNIFGIRDHSIAFKSITFKGLLQKMDVLPTSHQSRNENFKTRSDYRVEEETDQTVQQTEATTTVPEWTSTQAHSHRTGTGSLHTVNTHDHPSNGPWLGPLFHMTNNSNPRFTFRQNPNWKNFTCPTSLQKRTFESKEFGPIFRPDTQMFMNSKLFDVSEYWRLKEWPSPFGYKYKENITYEEVRDVLNMFPAEDSTYNFTGGSRPECVSCAVVGNGGILNGSGMGKEIDMHDFVFRVNQAFIRGYEEDVGSRTTHYVFYDRSLTGMKPEEYPVYENTTYIFVPCRKADYTYLARIGEHRNRFKVPPENIRVIHPDFMRYMHNVWMRVRSFRPTTGGIMTMTALHLCDKLSLYGLGYCTKYTDHYFEQTYIHKPPPLGSHDYKREMELWDSLDKEGIVYWYRRDVF